MGWIRKCLYVFLTFVCFFLALHFKTAPSVDRFKPGYIYHSSVDRALYLGTAVAIGSIAISAKICEGFIQGTNPWIAHDLKNLSESCAFLSFSIFKHIAQDPPSWVQSSDGKWIPLAHKAWEDNRNCLSTISQHTQAEKELIHFLERRFLAKANGFYPLEINYVSPCFGMPIQVSPETKNCYARDPFSQTSLTYENRIAELKERLPHPKYYPVIPMRSCGSESFIPGYVGINSTSFANLSKTKMTVLDCTDLLASQGSWETCQSHLLEKCKEYEIDPQNLICIESTKDKTPSICILPLEDELAEKHHSFLLEWVSYLGLTATPIELDRISSFNLSPPTHLISPTKIHFKTISESINNTREKTNGISQEKFILIEGFLKNFEGLLTEIMPHTSKTKASIVQYSLDEITHALNFLAENAKEMPFLEFTSQAERAHLHLLSLLEIFHPFEFEDFGDAYAKIINMPEALKPMSSYGVLASGMSAIAGTFQALKGPIKIQTIYGKNTYFECIHLAGRLSHAIHEQDASLQDWENTDLFIAQFNPVLRRDNPISESYQLEDISLNLKKALGKNRTKKLTLALDVTVEYLHSTRVQKLLEEFQEPILKGTLSVVCFRSGLKFDLFGIDNYAGAPCFVIHNQDPQWSCLKTLLQDPALQTDSLSLQWFCLGFKNSPDLMDLYRKQIFDNTRAVLDSLPDSFYQGMSLYRAIHFEKDVDPAFIDLKISGPFHQARASAIVCPALYLQCMKEKQPIFLRRSFGFYHTNFGVLFTDKETTIRLTVGLDPNQAKGIADTLANLLF